MTTSIQTEPKVETKSPSPLDLARAVKARQGMARRIVGGTTSMPAYSSASEGFYSQVTDGNSVAERLDEESQEAVNTLYEYLSRNDILEGSQIVKSAGEVAGILGLNEKQVEKSWGILAHIEDGLLDSDTIDIRVISIVADDDPSLKIEETTPKETYVYHPHIGASYIGRVRLNKGGGIVSIVLDTVPYAYSNAAFVIRNDNNALEDISELPSSKSKLRAQQYVRAVHHTPSQGDPTGELGALKRINTRLTEPFDVFAQ